MPIIHVGHRKVEVTVKPGTRKGKLVWIVRPVKDAGASDRFTWAALAHKIRDDWNVKGFCVMSTDAYDQVKETV